MSSIEIDWLPMGSVVKLVGVDTPMMIVGRLQKSAESDEVSDYAACPYPCGFEDSSHAVLFNGDRVEHVLFLGYRTERELAWCKELTQAKAEGFEPKEANNA